MNNIVHKNISNQFTNITTTPSISDIPDGTSKVFFNTVTEKMEHYGRNGNNIYKIGGGDLIVDTTYANLVTLIGNSELIVGLKYRITDFATKHYIVDAGGNQYVSDIITGNVEPLIVTAIAVNKIDKIAISETYPQDIIYYDWNPDNWIVDASFSDLTNYNYADLSGNGCVIIAGFKGVIYFRHDTLQDNMLSYDFRNVKFRRWKADVEPYNPGTTYSGSSVFVSYQNYIYRALRTTTPSGNTPNINSDYWVRCIYLGTSEYILSRPTASINSINPLPLEYEDFLTFHETVNASYNDEVYGIHIGSTNDNGYFWYDNATILNNNVFFLKNINPCYKTIKIGNRCIGNTFLTDIFNITVGSQCIENIISGNINRCTIGDDFRYNILGASLQENIISGKFFNNTLSSNFSYSTISGEFTNNIIQGMLYCNISGYFNLNRIGRSFQKNIISGVFAINNIDVDFYKNFITSEFQTNVIGYGFTDNTVKTFNLNIVGNNLTQANIESINNTDFTSATLIYGDYNKTIFKNSAGVIKLSYYNGSNVLTIANPTD